MSEMDYLTTPFGRIAYRHQPGEGQGVLLCGGYRSDMEGSKATALAEWCGARNIPFTRFDYFAHGASEGAFIDFTIGHAVESALEILDRVAPRELLVVGSSMGGWVGLQAAMQRPLQIQAFIGVAAAPDFTDRLMLDRFSPAMRAQLAEEGVIHLTDFEENEYPVTEKFIAEARQHFLLDHPIPLSIPMHFLQGQRDTDVPWEGALTILEKLTGEEAALTLVKDADHRMSRPQDLQLLLETVERLRRPS